jgi:hypothetical protein
MGIFRRIVRIAIFGSIALFCFAVAAKGGATHGGTILAIVVGVIFLLVGLFGGSRGESEGRGGGQTKVRCPGSGRAGNPLAPGNAYVAPGHRDDGRDQPFAFCSSCARMIHAVPGSLVVDEHDVNGLRLD